MTSIMNPIYKFIISGQQGTPITYTQDNMTRGCYDFSEGVGNIITGNILSTPLQIYCLKLTVNAGDMIKVGTTGYQSSNVYPFGITDRDNRLIYLPDISLSTLDVPIDIEISQDGYIYINYYYLSLKSFSAELTQRESRECAPIYKDDLSKDYELEKSQQFFRVKLSGNISFICDDYDWLDGQSFDTQFIMTILQSFDGGKTWQDFLKGKFMKTDCTWDVDNKKCEVKPDTYDQYNDVMNGLEKKYNLIKLAPEMLPLTVVKRPLIQVYIPGDSVVTCFLQGTSWEQDVVETVDDENALVRTYHFGLASEMREVNVTANDANIRAIAGLYVGKSGTYYNADRSYYIKYEQDVLIGDISSDVFSLYRSSDDLRLYFSETLNEGGLIDGDLTFTPIMIAGASGHPTGTTFRYNVYMRWLTDKERVFDKDTYDIPQNDILDDNRNYRHCIGYTSDYFTISLQSSTDPTEYGQKSDGTYFTPPVSPFQKYYPVSRSQWVNASVWFSFSLFEDVNEQEGRQSWTLKDTYKLSSVINVLLEQFSSIRHEATAECSQFLYGTSNPISYQQFTLLITQKSNLLHGNYTQPAQKAEATLKYILDALKNIFQCYWYIEDGLLKIEHISFFKNGGTYNETNPGIGADLTNLENVRNNKKWGYLTSNYEFDKSEMPARYQFGWMDDVTEMFEGYPLEIRSKYVTEDQIEDVTVSNFTTDVDYMLLNPNAISEDGFALFAAVKTNIWIDRPTFFVYAGYLNANGDAVYNADGDGKGWFYTKFKDVAPGVTYTVLNSSGAQINGFYFHFYDGKDNSLGRASSTNGSVTIPENCATLGMSWRAQQDASPTSLGVVPTSSIYMVQSQQLGLPFVQRQIDGADLVMQNGYLSWITLLPNYWTYDLPSKNVTINETDYTLSHISRKKKQKVKFPTIEDLDTSKLVKTPLGNGQIEKISVNLSSRMNEVTLKYDTE